MENDTLQDAELMRLCYEGNEAAWKQLCTRYFGRLAATAYRCLPERRGRREAAEELAQEALLKLARTTDNPGARWQPEKGPEVWPWLRQILFHLISTFLDKRANRCEVSL